MLAILAVVSAALLPLAATAQTAPPPTVHAPKYKVFGGFAYTTLNQVNQSRYGLLGFHGAITRDLGKYWGLTGSGSYFSTQAGSGTGFNANPGNPSVYTFMFAPEVHFTIFGNWEGAVFGELGMEHTGGERMSPDTSFAGGLGGSVTYYLNRRWGIRAAGDRVVASFSLINNSSALSNSSHMTSNSRGMIGVVYRF